MVTGLVSQRNRDVAGNRPRRFILWRDIATRQQASLRTGQLVSFAKHRVFIAHAQQALVRTSGGF